MKRTQISSSIPQKWRTPILLISLISLLLLFTFTFLHHKPHLHRHLIPTTQFSVTTLPPLPKLAYLITGTGGESKQLMRLLQALYHPRNYYILHLDLHASNDERLELSKFAKREAAFRHFRNVMVLGKADLITAKGPTAVAATLHGVAILLKVAEDWDWFINLSVYDYPLFSQDDFLHILSYLPRDLNFLQHTSDIGWKENQRARPIIIDPGLYHAKKSAVFWAKEKRSLPSSFKLFAGSERVVLTKSFLDFCTRGWDNLPRTLLMYYTNFLSSSEGYFHTVVCNHKDYQNTTVNHDLHYMKWDNYQNQQPINLTQEHFDDMVRSGAPFAHRFSMDEPVLEKIDQHLLKRKNGHFVPGGWCMGNSAHGDPCGRFGSLDAIKPSVNFKRLEKLILKLLDPDTFRSNQCR